MIACDLAPAGDAAALPKVRWIEADLNEPLPLDTGSVDVIEQIPPSDIGIFQNRQDATLYSVVSTRVIYLAMDQGRDDSPYVTDKDGKPFKFKAPYGIQLPAAHFHPTPSRHPALPRR